MAELITTISKLSIADRIRLVQEILATISKETAGQEEVGLTDAQLIEIEKRSKSIANGTAKTKSWDAIEAALIERYDLQS
jgi:putative addiction module component (TIGR02574 family)